MGGTLRHMKFLTTKERLTSFSKIPVTPYVLEALTTMEITKPTAVQDLVIPTALAGADLIAVAQTGSGKTLAFALPVLAALEKNPAIRALILAPSREMAQQIFNVIEQLTDNAVSMAIAIGGVPSAKQTTKLNRQPKILIATPGRLNDHLMKNKLLLQNVEIVVIDEADRMLDMGFAPQLKSIQATMRGPRQTLMFSASFDTSVESIAKVFMREEVYMIRTEDSEAPVQTLKQQILYLGKEQKHDRLLDEINKTRGGVIVFCGSRDSCEDVSAYLKEYGVAVDMIHGELTQGHRNRVIREFREKELRVVVATDLLARGIDVEGVDHVINFELPLQAEDFLHRIGRTARAGRAGTAITFVTESDTRTFSKIQKYLDGVEEIVVPAGDNLLPEPRESKRPSRRERTDKYKGKSKRPGAPTEPSKHRVGGAKKPSPQPKTFGRRK
ncbi:DEAD/DEAH box helicase [soil metagenome]